MKNIVFFLSHPAQFHFAKNIIFNLKQDGCNVLILIKTKDILEDLVLESNLDYINIQRVERKNNVFSMAFASIRRTMQVVKYAKRFHADVVVGTDASVAHASWFLNVVSLTTLEDDAEIIPKLVKSTYPFSTHIVVPEVCGVGKWNYKKIGYAGYMKLAYLHPNRFVPNEDVVWKYVEKKRYCLVRLAKLTAHHDDGIAGLTVEEVERLVDMMENKGFNVFIHSEIALSDKLEKYHLDIASSDIHHVLYYSSLLVSDSQSMSMESAMLGVPSIRVSDFSGRISVLEELEHKYGLTYGLKPSQIDLLYHKMEQLLSIPDLREIFQSRRQKMLADKIDVTAFFVWLIENYPKSEKVMKENPDYQLLFR